MGHNRPMSNHLGRRGSRPVAMVTCLVLLAACGGTDDAGDDAGDPASPSSSAAEPTTEPSGEPTSEPPASRPATGTEVVTGESDFGAMLFDDTGQAIYLFDVERTSEPRCYDDCAVAWPPVLTEDDPVAGAGVDASLLGTVERTDGKVQVTYNDHPLYFYAHEGKHEVLCHDVFLNGGNWYVVQPGGDAAPPG